MKRTIALTYDRRPMGPADYLDELEERDHFADFTRRARADRLTRAERQGLHQLAIGRRANPPIVAVRVYWHPERYFVLTCVHLELFYIARIRCNWDGYMWSKMLGHMRVHWTHLSAPKGTESPYGDLWQRVTIERPLPGEHEWKHML